MQSVHPITEPDFRGPLKPGLEKPQQQPQQQPQQPQNEPTKGEKTPTSSTTSMDESKQTEGGKQSTQQRSSSSDQKQDATHRAHLAETGKLAFQDLKTPWGRFLFALVGMSFVLVSFFSKFVMGTLGLRSNEHRRFRLRRIITDKPRVWIGEYLMPVGSSNCVIIRGKDGSLFIRSPPEPTANIVQTIRDEGDPSAFLLSPLHDTFGDKWKEMFPNATILAAHQDMAVVNERVKVDMALEDASELLKNFYITDCIPTTDWSRHDDSVLMVQMEDSNKLAAIFGCGLENNAAPTLSLSRLQDKLLGRARLRIISLYAYMLAKSPEKAQAMWQRLMSTQNLDALIFLHGEPILGEHVRSCMRELNMRNMKWAK